MQTNLNTLHHSLVDATRRADPACLHRLTVGTGSRQAGDRITFQVPSFNLVLQKSIGGAVRTLIHALMPRVSADRGLMSLR